MSSHAANSLLFADRLAVNDDSLTNGLQMGLVKHPVRKPNEASSESIIRVVDDLPFVPAT